MNVIRGKAATALLAAAAIAGGLSACKKTNEYASNDTAMARTDSAAGSTTDTSMAKTDTAMGSLPTSTDTANNGSNGWTDAGILGYVEAANSGEIQLGQLAEKMATNPKVKSFAHLMVTDHRAMQHEAMGLAKKLNITPDTTADNARSLMNDGSDALKDLRGKTAGADWDKDYMDKMIDGHQKVLDKLQDASKNTTNAQLRSALEKSVGKVQSHLTKAQDIKSTALKA